MTQEKLQKKQKKWLIQLREYLNLVKESYDLESITLIHRTGGPLESAGNWQSKNEIFGLCASVLNITNDTVDIFLGEVQKFFMDLGARKILVIPLLDGDYIILITAVQELNNPVLLTMLDETFVPSLSKLLSEHINPFLKEEYLSEYIQYFSDFISSNALTAFDLNTTNPFARLNAPPELTEEVKNFIFDYFEKVPDIKAVSITLDTNSILYWIVLDPAFETLQKTSSHLFKLAQHHIAQASMYQIRSLLIECPNYSHLIYRLDEGLFSTIIGQDTEEISQIRSYATKAGHYVRLLAS